MISASAQTAKYRALCPANGLKSGDHVLRDRSAAGRIRRIRRPQEIGCGVTGLTISREQLAFARERIERRASPTGSTCASRTIATRLGRYDGVVSIEMFEAVGEKNWPTYFSKVREWLQPGGKAGLQTSSPFKAG